MSKKNQNPAIYRKIEGAIFLAPWIIGFMIFMAFPLGYSLFMSFHKVQITIEGVEHSYRGLEYYKFILFTEAGILYNQLIPFLRQTLLMIPIIVIFALLVAIMLNRQYPGRTFFRAIFFLPVIFTTGQVIREFLSQGEGDLGFLEQYNVAYFVNTIFPESWANPIIAVLNSFVLILWYSGVQILIFLAGRQTISPSVYEAVRIDGASPWESFWKITLPNMVPFVFLNIIYTVVDLFTFPSNPIISQVNTNNYGQSSALAWIYFSIIILFLAVVVLVFNRLTRAYR
jgi:ABC-type sugar transport system permease subunit